MTEQGDDSLSSRLAACARDKVAVCLGLAVGICVPYYVLQRVSLAPLATVPRTPVDDLVSFDPTWTPVYLSIAALVPLAVWLQPDRDAVLRYAWGLAALCVPSFVLFAVFPVEGASSAGTTSSPSLPSRAP